MENMSLVKFIIISCIFCIVFFAAHPSFSYYQVDGGDIGENTDDASNNEDVNNNGDENILDEEENLDNPPENGIDKPQDEEVPQDEIIDEEPLNEPEEPDQTIKKPAPLRAPISDQKIDDEARPEGEQIRQIIIDTFVDLNYVFDNSPDNFLIKYHLHFEGQVNADVSAIKGNAEISSEVKGALAKWSTGECKLFITIADTPIGMTFKKGSGDSASLNVNFTKPITETWESKCTFNDAANASFNTKGNAEQWLAGALQKARPPLTRLTVPLSSEESTTMKFEISKHTVKDPPLGTAEIEGNGVVTIKPGR